MALTHPTSPRKTVTSLFGTANQGMGRINWRITVRARASSVRLLACTVCACECEVILSFSPNCLN